MKNKKWMYADDEGWLWTEGCGCCARGKEPSEATLADLDQLETTLREQLERVGVRIDILRAHDFNSRAENAADIDA